MLLGAQASVWDVWRLPGGRAGADRLSFDGKREMGWSAFLTPAVVCQEQHQALDPQRGMRNKSFRESPLRSMTVILGSGLSPLECAMAAMFSIVKGQQVSAQAMEDS